MAVNIGEIARQAGVSRSTVSYVLSGKRPIGAKTRERVLAIIEQANFRPSATARALAHGETRTLALVVPPLHQHLNIEVLQFVGAIAEAAAEHDFDTLLSPSGGEREDAFLRLIGESRVDGVLLMETRIPDPRVQVLLDRGFPFVTLGRTGFDDQHDWVDIDYGGLVTEAVTTLAAQGHRRIGLVNRPKDLLDEGYSLAIVSQNAFQNACARAGVTGAVVNCEENDAAGEACLAKLMRRGREVSAVVSVNDRSLVGLVAAAAKRGLNIPGDLAVMAVAADRIAEHTDPPITAATVPAAQLGKLAVRTLLARLSNQNRGSVRELIRPSFTDRGSVGPHRAT